MTGSPVRIGLVGYGKGGRWFHAPLIASAEGCALAGVVVRDPQRRADLARDHPGVPAHGTFADLAAAGVDAVVVSTPLDTHLSLVREAVDRRLPVVCDKPFAPDAASARAAVLAAEQAGVLLSIYQNRRWDADYRTIWDVLSARAIGDVVLFESRMEQVAPPDGVPASGGGVLLDLGSHAIDQVRCLFGPIRSVYADVRVLPGGRLDDRFFAVLRHACGITSHVTCSLGAQGEPRARFRVTGTAGTCMIEDDDGQTAQLMAGLTPTGLPDTWGTVPPARWGRIYSAGRATVVPPSTGSWSSFYSDFARAVRGEAAPPVDPWDAVATLEVLDAARRSATTGQVVELPDGRG